MRHSDEVALKELFEKAERGELSRHEVAALFMYLRGSAKRAPMVRDLGDTVAHDERDRGQSFTTVVSFVSELRSVFEKGGNVTFPMLFSFEALVAELDVMAAELQLPLQASLMLEQRRTFIDLLANLLDGTEYKVAGATAQILAEPIPRVTVFFDQPIVGVINLPTNVGIACPVLEMDDERWSQLR